MRETVSTAQHHSRNPDGGGVSWVEANYTRRTGHPKEDLEQLAAIGAYSGAFG
jgi:hypothetical protein